MKKSVACLRWFSFQIENVEKFSIKCKVYNLYAYQYTIYYNMYFLLVCFIIIEWF